MQQFRHEALFYDEEQGFLAGTVPFIREGVANGEPVLVALAEEKIALLERELGEDAEAVEFVEMAALGRNPARIIPVWRDFAARLEGVGGQARGIGEPVWPGRSADELVECDHHESLLNRAFADAGGFTLLCPYDAGALDAEVLEAARRNHPVVIEAGAPLASDFYVGPESAASPFDAPLSPPPPEREQLSFVAGDLAEIRRFVRAYAVRVSLDPARQPDLIFAVNELAANSLRHGNGEGLLRTWHDELFVRCEVEDDGRLVDPLVGRMRPEPAQESGRGLWLVHQLCDLVQLRSNSLGTVARVSVALN